VLAVPGMHTIRLLSATLAAVLLLGPTPSAAAATLKADYQFQGTLASSVGTPPDLATLGSVANTYATETVDGQVRTVLSFPADNGVVLVPTTGVVPNDRYSIVILLLLHHVDSYRRLNAFNNGQADVGFYLYNGHLLFYPNDVEGSSVINADTWAQVVLTRDGTGLVSGYLQGLRELVFIDGSDAIIDSNNMLRFFRDDECGATSCGEDSDGEVARIRLFDDALTPDEVAALDRLPTTTTTTTTLPPSGCNDFATRTQIDAECDCAAATKHGAYVHCASQVISRAVKAGTLGKTRKGAVKACAARSTCGKPGFVTCCRTTAKSVTRCSIKSDPAKCKATKGGTARVGTHASCCDACTENGCLFPSPAFFDAP
jgi:hypothetical protein